MSKKQREKGVILSYITIGVNFVIGILFTPFITKSLGQSEYGLYSLASSIIAYLTILDLGLGSSMIRFSSRAKAMDDKDGEARINGMFLVMYGVISFIALIIGLILYHNIEPFFTKFNDEEIQKAKIIFLILLANSCVSLPFTVISAILSSYEQFAYLKSYQLITNVVKYSLEAAVLAMGFKSIGVATAAVVVSIGSKIFPIAHIIRMKVKFSFKSFDKALFKEIITYSSFIFINLVVDTIYSDTDKIILGKFVGATSVAVYGIASNICKDFSQFSTSINSVFLPNITKLITKDKDMSNVSAIFIRIGRIQFIILALVFSGFLIFGKDFIHYWVGDDYAEAYYISLIRMAPAMFTLSQNIGVTVLQAMNKHKIRSLMYLVISIINVIISIPLAIKWGGIGAAIGTLIGNILGQLLFMNWYYYKKIGLDIPGYWKNTVLKIGSVAAIYCAISYFIYHFVTCSNIFVLLCGIAIYSIGFILLLWFVILNDEEKGELKKKSDGILKKLNLAK